MRAAFRLVAFCGRLAAVALLAAFFGLPPRAGLAQAIFQVSTPSAILVDAQTGAVLFEKNADQKMPPASLAKLMTAAVVFNEIRLGRLKLTDEFTVSENAWRKGGGPSGGSTMFAVLNSRISVSDLLHGVIIQSGNDACIVLAEGIAGNEANFAGLMQKYAAEIGLKDSVFRNATGLHDPEQVMTARDLSKLALHIIQTYPEHFPIYGQREFTWNKIRQPNRNPLLNAGIGADGMKTGFIKESGYGIVGTAVQNGARLVGVVLGAKTDRERADEARKLIEYGFRAFEARLLFEADQTVGEARVFGGTVGHVPLAAKIPVRALIQRGSTDKIVARIVYNGPIRAPVVKGTEVGRIRVFKNDAQILELPLYATADVERGSLFQRALDAGTETIYGLFRAGAERL